MGPMADHSMRSIGKDADDDCTLAKARRQYLPAFYGVLIWGAIAWIIAGVLKDMRAHHPGTRILESIGIVVAFINLGFKIASGINAYRFAKKLSFSDMAVTAIASAAFVDYGVFSGALLLYRYQKLAKPQLKALAGAEMANAA